MSSSVSLEYLNNEISGLTVSSLTQYSLCAQNSAGSSITIIPGGTAVPLPTRPYINGFTANGANTVFTVAQTGTYYIEYRISTTASLLMSSSVYRNGASIGNLVCSPGLAGTQFNCSAIVGLTATNTLQLMLYGLEGTTVLQGGVGAYMNIMRIA